VSDQAEQSEFVAGVPIVVNEAPMLFWDDDHPRNQLRILGEIDTHYFRYLADTHRKDLEGPSRAHAGIALRIAYSHAAEALLSLVCAALQAPHYPIGWLLMYQYRDMRELIEKIQKEMSPEDRLARKSLEDLKKEKSFENLLGLEGPDWSAVVAELIPWNDPAIDFGELRRATVRLWRAVSKDVLDKDFDKEYMSLKHGFRVVSGPWHFALGIEEKPGEPAPRENMRIMGSSEFGSTFYRPLNLKKYNWMLQQPRVNWSPEQLADKIVLIANSIESVLTFLRAVSGDTASNMGFHYFDEDEVRSVLQGPGSHAAVLRFTVTPGIDAKSIAAYYNDPEQIREAYRELNEQLRGRPQEP
jgi:hypothetical protein